MSLQITRADAERLVKQVQSARASIKRVREEGEKVISRVVTTMEVGSTSFAFGLINGRWNGVEVLGVPLDGLTAFVLHGIGFFGIAPDHTHSLANGALASYLNTTGAGIGLAMKKRAENPQATAALPAPGAASGYIPPGGASGVRLTNEQLQALAGLAG